MRDGNISLEPLSSREYGTLSTQRTTMLAVESIWLKIDPAFHFFFHQLWNYDSHKTHQARSWKPFNFWSTSGDGKKRFSRMWRSESFEMEAVSPGLGFLRRIFGVIFVSVVNRNSPNYVPFPSATRPKRTAVHFEDSQRTNLNTKRIKLDNDVSYN